MKALQGQKGRFPVSACRSSVGHRRELEANWENRTRRRQAHSLAQRPKVTSSGGGPSLRQGQGRQALDAQRRNM